MDKEFVIKQWLKESEFDYTEYRDTHIYALRPFGPDTDSDVSIQLEGPPGFTRSPRKPAEDEVLMVVDKSYQMAKLAMCSAGRPGL
jgi:hypothetical protein